MNGRERGGGGGEGGRGRKNCCAVSIAALRSVGSRNEHPASGRHVVDMDVRHDHHFRLRVFGLRCGSGLGQMGGRHASIAHEFRVSQGADAVKVSGGRDFSTRF